MSLFIIDPIDDLSSALAGKNNIEKHQYLEMIFNVKIDKRIEEVGYWILLQNEKWAFFSLKTNSLLKMPHEESQSEYFWNITSLVWVKTSDDSDIFIIFSMGWVHNNNELSNVDTFCIIKDGKIDVADGVPPGSDFQTGVNMIVTQEATRDIRTMAPERQQRGTKSWEDIHQLTGWKRILH